MSKRGNREAGPPRKRHRTNAGESPNLSPAGNSPSTSEDTDLLDTGETDETPSKFFKCYKYKREGERRIAICLECKKKNIHKVLMRKDGNTSGLIKHLKSYHPAVFTEQFATEKNSNLKTGQKKITDFNSAVTYSQEDWDARTINLIAYKKLPFNFFDDKITQNYYHDLNPSVQMPLRDTARRKTVLQYEKTKANVKQLLAANNSKVSFTIDGWTSINSRSYYGLTGHFIMDDWRLYSLALDFVPARGKHSGRAIAKAFLKCIKDYELQDKIQGITVDNASENTTFMQQLSQLMKAEGYDFDPINQHFRCFAHILNLGVQDILKMINVEEIYENENDACEVPNDSGELNDNSGETGQAPFDDSGESDDNQPSENSSDSETFDGEEGRTTGVSPSVAIFKLRSIFIKLRRSEDLQIILQGFCSASRVIYLKTPLDVSTRWNSTDNMIDVGLKMKTALNLFCEKCEKVSDFKLSEDEWTVLERLHDFLKDFKNVSGKLGGDTYVTLPLVVGTFNLQVNKIESTVAKLDSKIDRNNVDEALLLAFQAGRDKMLKHYNKTNWVYCAALILDPRHKVETFSLSKWGQAMKRASYEFFESLYRNYYHTLMAEEEKERDDKENRSDNTATSRLRGNEDDELDINSLFADATESKNWLDELNEYLSLKRADKHQNILDWWKTHESTFPTLARMAKDIFSTPATSVPAERLFSLAGLVVTKLRNSLSDESLRASLCLHSWIKSNLKDKLSIKI